METSLKSRTETQTSSLAKLPFRHVLVVVLLIFCSMLGVLVGELPILGVLLTVALGGAAVLLTVRFVDLGNVMILALMAGLALSARTFAKIPLVSGPVPLYPVDFTMIVLAASFGLEALRRGRMPQIPMLGTIGVWTVYGLATLLRSFFLYDDRILLQSRIPTSSIEVEIVRDSVMVFYVIFTVFFAVLARDPRFLRRFFIIMVICGILTSIASLTRIAGYHFSFLPFNSLIYPGLISVVAWALAHHFRWRVRLLIYVIAGIVLFETAVNGDISRASLIGLIATFLYLSFIATPPIPLLQIRRLVITGTMALAIALVIVIAYIVQPHMLLRANTADFRLLTWMYTFQDALKHPIFGWAFGNPMVTLEMFEKTGSHAPTNDPHNTWLALYYRLGLVGSLIFAWLNYAFFMRCIRAIRNTPSPLMRDTLRTISGIQVFVIFFGAFNLLLESPHYALWYWGLLGMGLTVATAELERLAGKQTEPLEEPSAGAQASRARQELKPRTQLQVIHHA